MNKRFYLLLAVLALSAWALITILKHRPDVGPKIGSLAPEFSLGELQGKNLSLSSLRGKVVLVNFWATWCGPCRQEMPSLDALYQKFKNRDFVVLGVSEDDEGWTPVRDFLKSVPIHFPIVLDSEQKVGDLYQTFRIPETYLIDRDGKIATKYVGPQNYDQEIFYRKIEELLEKNPEARK